VGTSDTGHHDKHGNTHAENGDDEIDQKLYPGAYPQLYGTDGNKPVASIDGRTYWSDDQHVLWLDTGSSWQKMAVADHADLNGIGTDDHHTRYDDSEAISAINNDGDHGSTASHNYYTDSDAANVIETYGVDYIQFNNIESSTLTSDYQLGYDNSDGFYFMDDGSTHQLYDDHHNQPPNTQLSKETVQDYSWDVLTGVQDFINVTYDDSNNEVDFDVLPGNMSWGDLNISTSDVNMDDISPANVDLDMNNNNIDDVASIDGGGNAVQFNDQIITDSRIYVDNHGYGGNPSIALAIGDTDTGIHSDTDGRLEFWENNDERVTLENATLTMQSTDIDLNNNNINDVASIDGGGNGVDFDDDVDMGSNATNYTNFEVVYNSSSDSLDFNYIG